MIKYNIRHDIDLNSIHPFTIKSFKFKYRLFYKKKLKRQISLCNNKLFEYINDMIVRTIMHRNSLNERVRTLDYQLQFGISKYFNYE